MALDLGKANIRKAEKALISAVAGAINDDEKPNAKAIFEVGCEVFGKDDFSGACEEKADKLKNVVAKAQPPKKGGLDVLKGLLQCEDLLEQEMHTDEAGKIAKLGQSLCTKEEYGKSRQMHLKKDVQTRND